MVGAFVFLFWAGVVRLAMGACTVSLVAQGVRDAQGSVGFVVFASPEGWPASHEAAFRTRAAPARPGDVVAVMEDLPPGRYAVVTTHDANGNKRLDRTPGGRPVEGWGMSNNPKATLKTPSFKAAAVDVECGSRVEMLVRYSKNSADVRHIPAR